MRVKKLGNNQNKRQNKKIAVLILAVAVFIGMSIPAMRANVLDSLSAVYSSVLVLLTNRERASNNASELIVNPVLVEAAQLKANHMAENGYFSHNTPDGKTPWYWFDLVGYGYLYAGENLAVNFEESEDIHNAWIRSITHKANILNRNYTEIGIATSTGIYKGREAIFVVQMFGRPI